VTTERWKRSHALWVAVVLLAVVAQALISVESRRRERDARTAAAATQGATYFVVGGVARPGAYTLGGATPKVRQALNAAGVVAHDAGAYALIVRRSGADEEMIKVELGPLLRDGTGDEPLRPGDQVFVSEGQ
jgi:protein involved in polysaccharide export with SLBB domain